MNNMKKLASLLLALVMLLAVAAPAMAYEIKINGTEATPTAGHTYNVYQIFTGDLHENEEKKLILANVKYGTNYTPDATKVGDEVPASVLEAITDAREFADSLIDDKLIEGDAVATLNEGNAWTASGLAAGYYLIQDVTENVPAGDSLSAYIVQVVQNVTIAPKSGTVESEKKVKDTNDSTGVTTDWQDSADYDINDVIPFQLMGKVPANYDDYTEYTFIFHDKQSEGLTFDADSVVVKVDGKEITTGYSVVTADLKDNCTFEVRFADLKKITEVKAGSEITVEYNSTLNENAAIGSTGNPNEMYLEYSNEPDSDGTGKTPVDKVIVFTYKVVVNKVKMNPDYDAEKDPNKTGTDSEGNKMYVSLEDAGFTLYKKNANGEYVAVGAEMKGAEMTTFVWERLDDGDYKLIETTTPAGYNTIEPIEFTITATHNEKSDDPQLLTLTGGDEFTGEVSTGTLSAQVINEKGVNLPSTGGMGTTLFYLMGAVLLVGAAVVVVSKKRAIEK